MIVGVLLTVAVVTLIGLLLAACHKIEVLQERERMRAEDQHSVCVQRLVRAASYQHAASVLRTYADKWGSAEEQDTIARISREWMEGPKHGSIPSTWLHYYADLLDPLPAYDTDAHTLNGERT